MPVCASCGRETADDFAFCPHCGAPLAAAASAREQRKTVTVLFCDLVGSTALGESADPEALRALLGRYFEQMKEIVERHGGSVEKFIGDAVMAVFGVPTVHSSRPGGTGWSSDTADETDRGRADRADELLARAGRRALDRGDRRAASNLGSRAGRSPAPGGAGPRISRNADRRGARSFEAGGARAQAEERLAALGAP